MIGVQVYTDTYLISFGIFGDFCTGEMGEREPEERSSPLGGKSERDFEQGGNGRKNGRCGGRERGREREKVTLEFGKREEEMGS